MNQIIMPLVSVGYRARRRYCSEKKKKEKKKNLRIMKKEVKKS